MTPDSVVVTVSTPTIDMDSAVLFMQSHHAPTDAVDAFCLSFGGMLEFQTDPSFLVHIFEHESQCGTEGICPKYNTKNPGNVRSSSSGRGEIIDTEKGEFVKFESWEDGWYDMYHRLRNPKYPYTQQHAITIHDILYIWAPPSDNNDTEAYIHAVVAGMNERCIHMPSDRYSKIGDYPVVWIPAPTSNYDTSREDILGIGVHDIEGSAQSGLDTLLNPYREASTHFIIDDVNKRFIQMVGLYSTAWTLGNYYYNQRAINIEQPGWYGKPYSPVVVEMMGVLSGFLCKEFEIPIRHCNRNDIERTVPGYWAHEDIPDPSNPGLYGGEENHTDPGPTYPWDTMLNTASQFAGTGVVAPGDFFPETSFGCAGGFYQRFRTSGAIDNHGYPISREYDTTDQYGVTTKVQWFQRSRFEWRPGQWPEKWDTTFGNMSLEMIDTKTYDYWMNDIDTHPDAFVPYSSEQEWKDEWGYP